MDILAHGLWTGILYRRSRPVWLAVLFGMLPDVPWLVALGPHPWPLVSGEGLPPLESLPVGLVTVGLATHSLIVFAVLAGFVWLAHPRWLVPFSAWGLHILIDIISHADIVPFTGTKFLYPISNVSFSVINWNHPVFLGLNYTMLAVLVVLIWRRRVMAFFRRVSTH